MSTITVYPGHFVSPTRTRGGRRIPSGVNKMGTGNMYPRTNIMKTEKGYHIELALPGYSKDEINIQWNDEERKLTFTGSTEKEGQTENAKFLTRGFTKRNFERVFTISKDLDAEKIDAEMNNGILSVFIHSKKPIVKNVKLK